MAKKKLLETLAFVMACLLVVTVVINDIAHAKAGLINETLGIQTSRVVYDEKDNPADYQYYPQLKDSSNIEEYYKAVNIAVEDEGMVLLKNENGALPLTGDDLNVSLVLSGSAALLYATHGPGAAPNIEKTDLRTALSQNGFTVNETLFNYYASGDGASGRTTVSGVNLTHEKEWTAYPTDVRNSIDDTDTAIVVFTRVSGEGSDVGYAGSDGIDGSYLSVTEAERGVLAALAQKKAEGRIRKIVVLLNTAMTVRCDFLFDETLAIDAALWIGNPGGNGTISVAKVLKGEVNPSGRLSDTLLKDNFSAPANAYWLVNNGFSSVFSNAEEMGLNAAQRNYGVYVEGIYVGYRYFETRYEDYVTQRENAGGFDYDACVAYPFGYGLSYTSFEYSGFGVQQKADGDFDVAVTVTNTGDTAGKEVVQVYMQQPYTEYDQSFGIEKSAVALAGFEKTGMLEPGRSETLHITVQKEAMRAYDAKVAKTYILDAGDYYLAAGRDAHDAVNNILACRLQAGDPVVTPSNMNGRGDASLAAVAYHADALDTAMFAVSEQTGEAITNRLDFMDPNRFNGVTNAAAADGKVTYVSRTDWNGTFPAVKTDLALVPGAEVKYDITPNKPIVEDEGAQMPVYGENNGLTLLQLRGKAYNDETWDRLLNQLTYGEISKYLTDCFGYTTGIGSIVKPYTDEDDGPYGVSHSPYAYSSMSCEGIIASTFNRELFAKVGEAFAADARRNADLGVVDTNNLNGLYSPGLNMHRTAFGGRASEYFSEDPLLSAVASVQQIREMQKQGVIAHVKHFILNDEESNRNGIGIWATEQAVREFYLLPWEYSCSPLETDEAGSEKADGKYGGAHAIMTSFNRAGCLWTSASSDLMFRILRDEWAWDGYAITDMAESNGGGLMELDDGFMNGTTCFLKTGNESTLDPYASSPTFNLRVREAAKRMLYVTANFSSAMNGISPNTRIERITPWWEYLTVGLIILAAVLTALFLALYILRKDSGRKPAQR
ncbi:MAG: glycoside hydrolase family 3 C-terminal domain-containing protein [Clostridia bacterium]|nr:glycoside hydrolase family 3 C-terminal domain-containing protein [Clostridia bacterium]